jgi:hypothetical protein
MASRTSGWTASSRSASSPVPAQSNPNRTAAPVAPKKSSLAAGVSSPKSRMTSSIN